MNAVTLRNLLLAGITVTLVIIGTIIYFASTFLAQETNKTIRAKIDTRLSAQDIDRLRSLERTLETNKASIDKANQIVSESKQYEYQDQIIRDINSYAAQTGVSVVGYDFGTGLTSASTATNPNIPKINGVKSLSVTLNLQSPMPYDNYLRFIKAIEQNLTKMQISGVNLAPDDKNSNNISNPSVVLIVYVR